MSVATDTGSLCPKCKGRLAPVSAVPTWCTSCEWRLGVFDAQRAPRQWAFRLGDRVDHWIAFRLNRRRYASSAGRSIGYRGNPFVRVALWLLAVPMLLVGPVCVVYGCYLMATGPALSPVLGFVLVLAGAPTLWPWPWRRHRRGWEQWPVGPAEAPAFFALIGRVAAAAGAPMPHEIVLDHHVDAYTTVRGLRRRRVLAVGLPLWASLAEQERIVLLAHELGHFVNHDSRRGLVVGGGLRALRTIMNVLGLTPRRGFWLIAPFLFVLTVALWLISTAMLVLIGQDSQRAEYLADQIATRVGGSAAASTAFDALIVASRLYPAMAAGRQDRADPKSWRAAALHAQSRVDIDLARQLSLREQASLLFSHPPFGLRGRMVRSRPACEPEVTFTAQEWAAADVELAPWFAKLRTRIADHQRY